MIWKDLFLLFVNGEYCNEAWIEVATSAKKNRFLSFLKIVQRECRKSTVIYDKYLWIYFPCYIKRNFSLYTVVLWHLLHSPPTHLQIFFTTPASQFLLLQCLPPCFEWEWVERASIGWESAGSNSQWCKSPVTPNSTCAKSRQISKEATHAHS